MNAITIIGSGLAGYTLARELRKLDTNLPLHIITADDGTYYSKPQLSAALTHKRSAQALAGASAEKMAQQLHATITPNTSVTYIDATQQFIVAGNQRFAYSSLILAQGAEVISAPGLPASAYLMAVNNLVDYQLFRSRIAEKKRVSILGAGLVGCEFANDLHNGGYQVDIIALADSPLPNLLPSTLGKVLEHAYTQLGINWQLGTSIKNCAETADGLTIELHNGYRFKTDLLLSAIGLRPVLNLAQHSGITTKRGIVVDKYLRSNIANIYALGDCAEVAGHVHFYVAPLVICARALAQTLTGNPTAVSYPTMPIILKTPACPIVVCPPPHGITGEWQFHGEGLNQKGLFYDEQQQLCGFALLGDTVQEKLSLAEQIPGLF